MQRSFVCGKKNVRARENLWVVEGAGVCGTDKVGVQESMCVWEEVCMCGGKECVRKREYVCGRGSLGVWGEGVCL